jgi:ubiquinone/menaquinone biosynthesis C-methylase UbiE
MSGIDPTIREYYERGEEFDRLAGEFPSGPLELARTQELILRQLPTGPLDILDVGGGPGVYAEWLTTLGHRVHLIDPISLHVDQALARCPDLTAREGDARALDQPDRSCDVVLLLGPLYHLIHADDRLQALREAHRVLRDGGLLFAAGISRYAALLDLLVRLDRLHEPDVAERVREAVATGIFHGNVSGLFTTAYFHMPDELLGEVSLAEFHDAQIFNVEGPGFLIADFTERWSDPARRDSILWAARVTEREPVMMGASSHLLVVARI